MRDLDSGAVYLYSKLGQYALYALVVIGLAYLFAPILLADLLTFAAIAGTIVVGAKVILVLKRQIKNFLEGQG